MSESPWHPEPAAGEINGIKQVTISPATGNAFFRLYP